MPDLLSQPEREQLERLEGEIEQWQTELREALAGSAGDESSESAIDPAYLQRFRETAQRLSSQLHNELPPDLDPQALAEIRGHLLDGLEALHRLDEDQPLNSIDEFLVQAEAVRHIVRDALDGQPAGDESDAGRLLAGIMERLPGVTRKELGDLLGISDRQVQRLMKDEGRAPSRRLQLVARLVALLWRAWTARGVVAWFYRKRPDLEGKAPIDVLEDAAFERDLMLAARKGRAQHGS
jgi:transcriptional regulator with XRE-family HTH domain